MKKTKEEYLLSRHDVLSSKAELIDSKGELNLWRENSRLFVEWHDTLKGETWVASLPGARKWLQLINQKNGRRINLATGQAEIVIKWYVALIG